MNTAITAAHLGATYKFLNKGIRREIIKKHLRLHFEL